MKKVDIKENLFNVLIEDYDYYKKNKDYQNQFQTGMDFFEAVIKFFGCLNISLVKQLDEEIYKKIIAQNFKEKPSLGDYKSLAVTPFTKTAKSLKQKNEFYNFLEKIFKEKNKLSVYSINSIKGEEEKKIEKNTLFDLFESYLVTFRNQLKGHSASFRQVDEREKEFVEKVIFSVDSIVKTLKKQIDKVLEKVDFFEENSKLIAKYQDYEVNILPLMIYIPCNKYSCCQDEECNEKRVRIFFFNDKTKEKFYYLDYGFNHFYNLKDLANENLLKEVKEFFEDLKKYQEKLNFKEYINNESKHKRLLENFVGREEELKILKNHINSSNASFAYVVGKPGIGKSALMAKLIDELKEENINTLLYYANSANMGGDRQAELKTIYSKTEELIRDTLNDKNLKIESECITDKFDKLFKHFEKKSDKPVLIVLDGLDEFKDYRYIVDSIPFNFSEKIHFIFTSRDYDSMIDHISKKAADYNSSINILTTSDENQTKYYLELKRLSDEEVEELIHIALPKEVKKRDDYEDIIKIVIEKSESLPLYLDYLISILKEEKISLKDFKTWASRLPKGIDEFYRQSFKKASKEAMNILYLLYFSFNSNFRDLKVIFANLENHKIASAQEFNKFFNEIEIFLDEKDGNYTFYHQSVKDAIELHLNNLEELFILDNSKIEETLYFNPNEKIIYLDEEAEVFKLLEEIINLLKQKQNLKFYTQNFFHLYYQYINFKLLQSILTINDIKNKDYSSILNHTELNEEIKNLIKDFLTLFDRKKEKYLFEIRFAYNLAFLIQDYKKVLKYMDEYQNYLYEKFLDIALNIDKVEKVKEFIELKEDWINNVPTELKEIYIEIIAKKEKLPDEFVEVVEFLNYLDKMKLISKINIEKAIETAKSIDESRKKSEALWCIAKKLADNKLFYKAIDVAKSIKDNEKKSEILKYIVEKMPVDKKLFEIMYVAESIKDSWKKSEALAYIAEKKNDEVLFNEAIETAESIDSEWKKSKALAYIAEKRNDEKLFERAIDVAKIIKDCEEKSEALKYILERMPADEELFEIVIYVAENIKDNEEKLEVLKYIVKKMPADEELFERAIDIAENINSNWEKSEALKYIIERLADNEFFDKAIKIVENIKDNEEKSKALAYIAEKRNDEKLFERAIDVSENIYYDWRKSETLKYIVKRIPLDKELFERALNAAEGIDDSEEKSKALKCLVIRLADKELFERALNVVENIKDNEEKSKALAYIAEKRNDEKLFVKAIDIAESIDSNWKKSEVLAYIAEKKNNEELFERTLNIAEGIYYNMGISEALKYIIERMPADEELFERAIDIAESIKDNEEKSKVLAYIAEKRNDEELFERAIDIAESIDDSEKKLKVLISIVEKLADKELFDKAIKVAESIEYSWKKSEALEYIVERMPADKELFERAIKIAESIKDKEKKLKTFIFILNKNKEKNLINKKILLDKILKTLFEINDEKRKINILNSIEKIDKNENLNKYISIIKNPLTQEYLIDSFNISNTLDVLSEMSYEDVLEYFGIEINKKQKAPLEGIDEEQIKNVKEMLSYGMPVEKVAEISGVGIETVKHIKESNDKTRTD